MYISATEHDMRRYKCKIVRKLLMMYVRNNLFTPTFVTSICTWFRTESKTNSVQNYDNTGRPFFMRNPLLRDGMVPVRISNRSILHTYTVKNWRRIINSSKGYVIRCIFINPFEEFIILCRFFYSVLREKDACCDQDFLTACFCDLLSEHTGIVV